jgi:hypothetical protein
VSQLVQFLRAGWKRLGKRLGVLPAIGVIILLIGPAMALTRSRGA